MRHTAFEGERSGARMTDVTRGLIRLTFFQSARTEKCLARFSQ